MATAAEKMAEVKARLEGNPEAAGALGASYKLVVTGSGGGTWLMCLRGTVSVSEQDGEADCLLELDADDLVGLLEGRTSAQQLFFSGKLKVEGDVGMAVRLEQLTALLA
jgi:putative sterol carrier protein